MSILLSANGITKSFGVRPLFEDLSFVVHSNDRIGLIGPNGAGKTTLLNILGQKDVCDSGDLSLSRGLQVGFLTQNPVFDNGLTVEQVVHQGVADMHDTEQLVAAAEFISRLELSEMKNILVSTLSGGWKKRVALARELTKKPALLLLDEPTNHLDIESILWLEKFLASASFATITVTHDRLFLQRVANRILELDRKNEKGLLSVDGDYAMYLERKEELLILAEREERVLKNTLRRETEWLRRGAKARTTKQQARIHATHALEKKVDELEQRNENRSARLEFGATDRKPNRLIEARGISKNMSGSCLFKDYSILISPGSRIGLIGVNGCGKSTLIRILLGELEPDSGVMIRAENLKIAYFDQHRQAFDPKVTLRKAISPHGDQVNYRGRMVHVHGYLDRFLFRKEQFDMQLGKLSGGEQARVLIAQLMQQEADILVLDEPTNDLDMDTLNVLQECLLEFDGAVLLVSHDRYFLDQVTTQLEAFPSRENPSRKIYTFAELSQWEDALNEEVAQRKQKEKQATKQAAGQYVAPIKKKLSFKETRELAGMEERIHLAEARLKDLESQSLSSELVSNSTKLAEIYQQISMTQVEIDTLYLRWAELSS